MRILVIGSGGLIGDSLCDALVAAGHHVTGLDSNCGPFLLKHRTQGKATTIEQQVDGAALKTLLNSEAFEGIVHLAGINSSTRPILTYSANCILTAEIIEAVRGLKWAPRLVLLSSAAVYGEGQNALTGIAETSILAPLNAYGASKAAMEQIAGMTFRTHGLDLIILRPFNVIGPRQSQDFLVADIASQVARIESGRLKATLHVASLDSHRDFIDVRDAALGIVAALKYGKAGNTYNLCSGVARSVGEVIDVFRAQARVPFEVKVVSKSVPNSGVRYQRGDPSKAQRELGWQCSIQIEKSILDILNAHRAEQKLLES
jgi:GDP-4-dehydro-6-deoxy-D-mannose reductase